ncbi:serine/threonine protein kinase [Butyrivibrio sp. DSM 10294]|uniref:serine/threonine protein kinase n=1 Tax=Butyrivibrio sp. DSM 10294 TaxID=2972457 RepID=UPI00234EA645|nr:serine/threonine-protein kinase [Butyrivibrio sp. DSM 10294]MDC7292472.1 serine/threonine protein kinase [Butyrivibrio sp. DSM 10294]
MLQIGSLVDGKYKVLSVIGQGGMSTVYLVMNEKANKPWAIKEVRKDAVANYQVVRQSLITETNLLKNLSHPYLPSIVDVIDDEGRFLIVMDYIEGNTLDKALATMGPQPQEYVIEWGIQLCDVFEYLHSRTPAIIYRDLKPANIMLRPNGRVCLIDFGTAREYKMNRTGDTQYLGTRGYAAPEQFGGMGQTDPRTDVYCLGATMYNLLTGHTSNEPPYEFYPIRYWNPSLSAGLEKIIAKCVQNNPADRYQSCAELMYDLQHYKQLDRDYKKTAKMSVALVALLTAGAVICGSMSYYFHNAATVTATTSYEDLLLDALGEEDDVAATGKFAEAIRLQPTNPRAFTEMLDNRILADDCFTASEDENLRKLLISSCDGTTIEKAFMANREAYDEFAYKLGMAYYYCYEDDGNKQLSLKWLKAAFASDYLEESQKARAQRLCTIAEYYNSIGGDDKTGDPGMPYNVYWENLVEIADGNIAEIDNPTTALMIYNEIASQVFAHYSKFAMAGVSYDTMEQELETVSFHIKNDIESLEGQSDHVQSLIVETKSNVEQAKKAIEMARSQGG